MECDCCAYEFDVDELKRFQNGDMLCDNCFIYANAKYEELLQQRKVNKDGE